MTIQELGSIGEFLAAIGVMFSLIYVGVQLQQGRRLTRIDGIERRLESWTAWRRLTMQDERLQEIWQKGNYSLESLSVEEKYVFDSIMLEAWLIVARTHFRSVQLKDAAELEQAKRNAQVNLSIGPGSIEWWQKDREMLSSPFREWVDGVLHDMENQI
jgi:hypothetical protein